MSAIKANLLNECIKAFHSKVSSGDIEYGWDCGHVYSYFSGDTGDIMGTAEQVLEPEEWHEFEDMCNTWLSDNERLPDCVEDASCFCNPSHTTLLLNTFNKMIIK